jgi:serine/threonine protein kinase
MLGTTIAHYKITAKLGQGGMGEVYRATDPKLDREVAIKVLPELFAQDKERLARFEREARVLAQLNHPNIAGVYGLEYSGDTQALILELVEGDDLSVRLKRGPLPVDEALEVCKQIAEALEAAHEKGIIHRDLKPGNIKLTEEGKVKVLDFGLAKALSDESDTSSVSNAEDSPTITDAFTKPGTILGTAAYMSPEQARGKHVDHRTDIWAFGCVLYECLTGQKTFPGQDVTETLAGIIKGEPDWKALPQETPNLIRWLLKKCLSKKGAHRLQSISDARIDLEQALSDPTGNSIGSIESPTAKNIGGTPKWVVAVMVALMLPLCYVAFKWGKESQDKGSNPQPNSTSSPKRSELILGEGIPLFQKFANPFALSKDGNWLAYVLVDGPNITDRQLYLRNLKTGYTEVVPDTQGLVAPFFSADSTRIGFARGRSIHTSPIIGGQRRILAEDKILVFRMDPVDWSLDGHIVFTGDQGRLYLMDENGAKQPQPITKINETNPEVHTNPKFLDAGTWVAFLVSSVQGDEEQRRIDVVNTQTREQRPLKIEPYDKVQYVPGEPGWLLCADGSDVFSIPFDLERLEPLGDRNPVLREVRSKRSARFDVANDGTLVYQKGHDSRRALQGMYWISESGGITRFSDVRGEWQGFALDPEEKRAAIVTNDNNIWLLDTTQAHNHTFRPLVDHPSMDHHPVWSANGDDLYFFSDRPTSDGHHGIWKIATRGELTAKPVLIHANEEIQLLPCSASSQHLMLEKIGDTKDIWVIHLNEADKHPQPFLDSAAYQEANPQISPNGKWVAYTSDETRGSAVHVIPIDKSSQSQIASKGRGINPVWGRDSNNLFWTTGPAIYTTTIMDSGSFTEISQLTGGVSFDMVGKTTHAATAWAVSPDKKRMLAIIRDSAEMDTQIKALYQSTSLNMITHWFSEWTSESKTETE